MNLRYPRGQVSSHYLELKERPYLILKEETNGELSRLVPKHRRLKAKSEDK